MGGRLITWCGNCKQVIKCAVDEMLHKDTNVYESGCNHCKTKSFLERKKKSCGFKSQCGHDLCNDTCEHFRKG